MHSWMVYTAVALILWGVSGVTQKLATNRISSQNAFVWFTVAMITISVFVACTTRIQWGLPWWILAAAAGGGMLNGLGALTSFYALESGGKASVVISLVALYPLLTVAMAVVFFHEKLTRTQGLGIALAIIAGILLSLDNDQITESASESATVLE